MRILPALALCLGVAAGCAAPPPPAADIDAADFGSLPITYRSETRAALARKLFDPPTAQLRFEEPFRGVVENGDFGDGSGGGWVAGWVVPVSVKARGSGGDYSGFLSRLFFFPTGGGVFELHDGQRVVAAPDPAG